MVESSHSLPFSALRSRRGQDRNLERQFGEGPPAQRAGLAERGRARRRAFPGNQMRR